jgi:hypothetical protein
MADSNVLPPGDSPLDPHIRDIDAVAFSRGKVRTFLLWIDEHRASFEKARATDPDTAERELAFLAHATGEALKHAGRLTELLLAGYSIDPSKRLPRDLDRLASPNRRPP